MTDDSQDTTDEPTQNQSENPDTAPGDDDPHAEPTERSAASTEQAAESAEKAAANAKQAAASAKQAAESAEASESVQPGETPGVQHVEVEASEQQAHIDELEVKKEIVEGATSDTTSTRTRHWLTNDIIAGILHISLVLLVLGDAFGTIDLGVIPPRIRLLYIGVVASAAIWTFGQGVLEAVRA